MKVAIYGQTLEENDKAAIQELLKAFQTINASVFIEEKYSRLISTYMPSWEGHTFSQSAGLDTSFDMFVSFGGDGTMLRAVTYVKDLGIPIVGVNTGRLGFLSTFNKMDVRKLVTEFIAGRYILEERTLVEVALTSDLNEFGVLNFALNEVAVSRKDTTSMITIETYLNGEYLTSYWADGLIIATPTGSTGYSLSCGGPVIAPTAKSFVITPIAPHNLNARPLVISDDTQIRVKVLGREEHHLISLDSRIASIPNGKEINIKKADFTVKMIAYQCESFLKTLRNKLLWGEDKRN